jgi:hypothetical protein
VGVLRDGQDDAIGFLPWPSFVIAVVMIITAMCAAGVFVSLGVSDMTLGRRWKFLEKMMHPMRRGRDQEETKRRSGA